MNSKPIVNLEKICKSYLLEKEILPVLKNIDLNIFQGESIAILGASGSGKSTLLHLIGCLDRPTSGKYFLNSIDVSTQKDEELSRIRASHIGFVFQSFNLVPQLTVFENVSIPFLYQNHLLSKKEVEDRVLEALEQVKLTHRLKHLPAQLSGGEAQRVAIARAVAIQPLILLADEPTGNLDSQTGATILEIFMSLNLKGTTFVMVTHDESLSSFCKRKIYMKDGSMIGAS